MSAFTPGPWRTDDAPNEQDDYCVWAPDGAFLANVGNGEKSVAGEARPHGGDCIAFDVTTRANAKLLAAAPDLYAALAEALQDGFKHKLSIPVKERMRAALAKAEGKRE